MDPIIATVTTVSPLTVTVLGGSVAVPANLLSGTPVAGVICYLTQIAPNTPPLVMIPANDNGLPNLDPALLPQSYGEGLTLGYFAGTGPDGAYGPVTTLRNFSDVAQTMHAVYVAGVASRIYQRTATGAGNFWNAWQLMSSPDTGWHTIGASGEPAYQNGHSAYDYGGTAGFMKSSSGMVSIQGLIGKAANASNVFVLPAGYRPKVNLIINAQTATGPMEMRVHTDGSYFFNNSTAAGWASIACSFLAGN